MTLQSDALQTNQTPVEQTPWYKVLNSNAIKLIAIIAMTIDHIAWAVFPAYSTDPWAIVMHIIGRLTKPIMWYCIAEGYHYTHDVKIHGAAVYFCGDFPRAVHVAVGAV